MEYRHCVPNTHQNGKPENENRYVAFIIRADREPMMIGLSSVAPISEAIREFRRPLAGDLSHPEAAANAGQFLRKHIWLPVEALLDGIDTVIISPDTVLGTLPFAALPGEQNGSYLLESYSFAAIPMATQLRHVLEGQRANHTDQSLLLVGDVAYDGPSSPSSELDIHPPTGTVTLLQRDAVQLLAGRHPVYEPLSGFRDELDAIHDLFQTQLPDLPVTMLSGAGATESAFLQHASQAQFIHLITHGYFADPDVKSIEQAEIKQDDLSSESTRPDPFINTYPPGLLSGLAMAGANHPSENPDDPHDGILRSSEIETSSLQGVDLVVLSACETGLGAVAGGEGLTGLQRAFQVAGARTVVASLWQVDDRATQELMTQFYTNLWVKKQSKIDALRNAQLHLLRNPVLPDGTKLTRGRINDEKPVVPDPENSRDTTDPYFWAAWTLSGDWR
jgi:CHAT domain-containing protein